MTDIVERLRDKYTLNMETCLEAADEIERLRAYVEGAIPNDEAGVQNLLAKTRNTALEEAAKVADGYRNKAMYWGLSDLISADIRALKGGE